MRKVLTILSLLTYGICSGQVNLIPNGDFEQYWHCPTQFSEIDSSKYWIQPTLGTSDYFNQCGTGGAGIPATAFGFQLARSGAGFAGLVLFVQGSTANYREYIEAPLDTPLVANVCYHFEMYINLANGCKWKCHNIGAYFSDSLYTTNSMGTNLPFIPQISNSVANNPDTLNWTIVSGNFIAVGGESYIIIGNFDTDINTNLITVNSSGGLYSYVFIEDVSLTQSITPCGVGITELNENVITIYPNPFTSSTSISFSEEQQNTNVKITDILGKTLKTLHVSGSQLIIEKENMQAGIYFIQAFTQKGILNKKIVVQ